MQQLKVWTLRSPPRSLSFSPRRACVTSPAQALFLSVSQIQNLPLSAPARSACPALLLLLWPLSLAPCRSLSLWCLPLKPCSCCCFFAAVPLLPAHLSTVSSSVSRIATYTPHPHPHPTPPTALSHLQTFPSPRPRSGVAVPLSTSPALLHVGELTGAAGTTGRL